MTEFQSLPPTIHWIVRSAATGVAITVLASSAHAALLKAARRLDDGDVDLEVVTP
jgi:hypothetical protein